jgi:hypothetical protein
MAIVEKDRTCSMMTISMAAIMAGKTLPNAALAFAASSVSAGAKILQQRPGSPVAPE